MARAYRSTAKDISSRRFGRLLAIEPTDRRSGSLVVWRCACDCGAESFVAIGHLTGGTTTSCGCWKRERSTIHGATTHRSASKEYSAWAAMVARCSNPKNPNYPRYGARGIRVCEQWRDAARFLADMGPCPAGLTLERKDNNGHYEPTNCEWASYSVQNRNTSQTRFFTLGTETLCMQDWCNRTGLSRNTINGRLRRGWTIERILTEPTR